MARADSSGLNILSVDVEDYFHVEAFADRITPEMWPSFSRRVVDNTKRLLDLFARRDAKATFFVLGWVAKCEPQIVRDILSAGHEVACHSFLHQRISQLTPKEFRADTRQAVQVIEDAGGSRILGYRAPTFSISRKSLWALEILAEQGFVYDSSIFPVHHDNYGMPEAPRFTYRWDLGNGRSLLEIPPLTVRLAGQNLPAAGGGYLRILPMWYTKWAIRPRSSDLTHKRSRFTCTLGRWIPNSRECRDVGNPSCGTISTFQRWSRGFRNCWHGSDLYHFRIMWIKSASEN